MWFASAVLTLFLVMDPLGNIPVFLSVLKRVPPERRWAVNLRENLIALGILIFLLFLGPKFFALLHVQQFALQIAGAVLLFIISLTMIFPSASFKIAEEEAGEPFIVPLATPMIVGPSTMATVALMASKNSDRIFDWLLVILVAWSLSAMILMLSTVLGRFIGRRGLIACERLMGMILTIVSVQMFLDGLNAFIKMPLQ